VEIIIPKQNENNVHLPKIHQKMSSKTASKKSLADGIWDDDFDD